MEPKEKAKELVDKMLHCYQGSLDEYTAKQCALIAVDEIMQELYEFPYGMQYVSRVDYWEEVKQEIEKL